MWTGRMADLQLGVADGGVLVHPRNLTGNSGHV
jgi:hypothetical protein